MKKMWKRFVSLLLACTLLAGMLPLSASAAEKPGEGSEQYQYAQGILNQLNNELGDGDSKFQLSSAASLGGDSDLFTYVISRFYIDPETNKGTTDMRYVIVPGVGASDTTMPNYSSAKDGQPWAEAAVSTFYIAKGVTGIGSYAFASQPSLNNVVFQDASDLTYIGQRAFYDDDNAVFTDEGSEDENATLDLSGVTTMGEYAFYNCDKLTGVELGGSITAVEGNGNTSNKIPNHAFTSTGVQSITVPSEIKEVGEYAFYDCPLNIDPYISLQEGLKTIGDYAFGKNDAAPNTAMSSLTIPSSVESIGDHAFYNYTGLQTVTVLGKDNGGAGASALTHVGGAAFGDADHNAYSTTTTIQDAVHPEIEYTGLVGTQFYLPKELEKNDKLFVNGDTCYTGDITPMQYVNTEPADCINPGYDIYKTTFTGAASSGEPIVMTYHYPIPALGHDYGPITEVKRTCENDNYFVQHCLRKNCPNKGDAVGSLWKSGIGMGLFDPDTDQKLTEEELESWREKFKDHEGHKWEAKSVVNPTIEAGKTTTLYYSCTNPDHSKTDRYTNPFLINLTGKTINALTTQSPSDIASQLVGFTTYGKVELVSSSDEPFGTEGIKYLEVKYTMTQDKNQNWPVFTKALEGTPDSASGTATLKIKVNVTKDVLDLSNVSILPNMVNVGTPAAVKAAGFGAATPGEVEYFADGEWTTTQPDKEGKGYKVRVKFTYNAAMYDLPEEGDLEYPDDGYTLKREGDSVWVEHSFVVALHQITAQARAISGLTYDETAHDTLEVIGLEDGWHVSVTAIKQGASEPAATWEHTGEETEENIISGLSLTDAGTYNVQVVFTYPGHSEYEQRTQNLEVHIDHKQVAKPVALQNMKYEPVSEERSGFTQETSDVWKFVDEGEYTHVGINAGKYTAKATLTNENYRWENTDEAVRDITIPWEILKRELYAPSINQPVYGYKYDKWVNPLVNPNSDYSFEPDKGTKTVKLVYIGNKDTDDYDQEAAVAYTAANAYHTNRGKYLVTVTLNARGNYVWFGNAPSGLEWTINPATLTLPTIEAEDADYTGKPYDAGSLVTVKNDGVTLPDDVKSAGYQYSNDTTFRSPSNNAPINAGTYFVRQNYTYNNQNYIAQIPYASFTINKATATMEFGQKEVTKTYTAEGTALQPVTVTGLVEADKDNMATVLGDVKYTYKYSTEPNTNWDTVEEVKDATTKTKFTDVGYYQITAKWGAGTVSNNYTAADAIYTLTITQANDQKITLTSAETNAGEWDDENNSYTTTYGSEKTFTVTGKAALDDASISYAVKGDSEVVSVNGSSGEVTIKQAGEATITVTAAETPNVGAASVDYTVTVKKAEPTVNTGLEGDELTVAYTGKAIEGYDKATPTANVVEGADQPFGDITYTFYTDQECKNKVTNGDGEGNNIPIAVGTYYMKATYPGDKNYTSAESKAVTVTVTEAQLTVDAEGYTGTYNGETYPAITIKSVKGNGEEITGYTVKYATTETNTPPKASDEVWQNTLITVKNVADSSSGSLYYWYMVQDTAGNYEPKIEQVNVSITPAALKLNNVPDSYSKTYDGDDGVETDLTGITVTGIATEPISVTATGTYDNKNAGEDKTVTLTLSLSGTETWGNYSYNGAAPTDGKITLTKDDAGTITPKAITVTGISAVDRVYDGTEVVQLTGEPETEDTVEGDNLTLTLADDATGSIADANVDEGKDVTVETSVITLGGTDKNNYTVKEVKYDATTGLTVNITQRPVNLEFAGIGQDDRIIEKAYTGQPVSVTVGPVTNPDEGTGFVDSDQLKADDVDYTYTPVDPTTDKNHTAVGSYTVTAALKGTSTGNYGNYELKFPAEATLKITPAEMVVTAKNYTGTYTGKAHSVTDSWTAKTTAGDQPITITGVQFIKKDEQHNTKPEADAEGWAAIWFIDVAQSGKYWYKVTAENYAPIVGDSAVTITINPATLTITRTVTPTKTYDGTVDATNQVTGYSASGVDGETIEITNVSASYDDANAGTGKTITITYTLSTKANLGNYKYGSATLSGTNATVTETVTKIDETQVGIAPAEITVTIKDQQKVYDGVTVSGISNPEQDKDWSTTGTIYSQNGTNKDDLDITLTVDDAKKAGTYAITGTASNQNYEVTFTGSWTGEDANNGHAGTYTISPRPIDVQIGNAEGFYGDAPVLTGVGLTYEANDDNRGLAPDEEMVPGIKLGTGANEQSPVAVVGYTIYAVNDDNQVALNTPTVIGNYKVTFTKNGTYTVNPRPITITIEDHSSVYGEEINGGITTPVSGVDYTVAITNNATTGEAIVKGDNLEIKLTTEATADSPVDDYDITGSAAGEKVNNYAITWAGNGGDRDDEQGQNGRYTIKPAQLDIAFTQGDQVTNGVSINITDSYKDNLLVLKNASTDAKVSDDDKSTLGITYSIGAAGGGDGDVSQIAEIDETTGEVTIHSTGTVRITAKVTANEGSNYTGTQTTWYELNIIGGGQMTLTVTPKTNLAYTGDPQALLESASCSLDSAEIQYSLDNQDWQNTIPTGTNAGTYTVYVKATDPNSQYSDVTEYVTVTIAKATLEGNFAQEEYTHVLTKGNSYDSATANELTIRSAGYGAEPAKYTYRSADTTVAMAENGGSTIRIMGSAGQETTITVTVPGDNNYNEGTFTYTLKISDDLSKIVYSVGNQEVTYNGQPQTIEVNVSVPASGATVKYWNEETKKYDLSEPPAYTDVKDSGTTIKFQITAPGYNTEEGTATLTIEPKEITETMIAGIAESYTYTGSQITFDDAISLHDEGVLLEKDKDYTINYGNNTAVGQGSVIITGKGNYKGSVTKNFEITPVDASDLTASLDRTFGYYRDTSTNNATVTVTHGNHEVTEQSGDTVSVTVTQFNGAAANNEATVSGQTVTFNQVGTYTIEVTVTGNHATNAPIKLTYALLPVEKGELVLEADNETSIVATYGEPVNGDITVTDASDTPMTESTDYTLTYTYTPFEGNGTNGDYTSSVMEGTPAAGMYVVTATGQGGYVNSVGTFTFLILQRDLADAILNVDDADLVFNHDKKEPDVTVSVTGDPVQGEDYTVTYYNNVNASDEAKAVVTAKGNNFTGSQTAEFTIAPKEITADMVQDIPDQHYTGKEVVPPVTIKDSSYTLILGYDYTTACEDKGPGAATVTIKGTGNYTGEVEKTFTIQSEGAPEPSERFDLAVTPSQWTWGDDLTNLRLSVTFGEGTTLTLGTNYTLNVKGGEVDQNFTGGADEGSPVDFIKSLKPGTYTITATGVGAYNGSTDTETVTIQKIQPEVTVTATPNSLSGGGKVTLTLKGEKLPDGTDLKNLLKVTAKNDSDVTLEDLHIQWPEDGSLTAELTLPNTSETYTFTLTFTGNEYYEAATASEQVVVAQQIISGGGGGGPVEDQPANPDDTGVSDWLNTKDHLAYLAGYPGGTFGPDQNMTRAEAAQMFYNLLLEKDVEITVEFEDVPADAWYAKPVNTLASLGILSGVGNGRFDPERSITRAEFTVIAMKFANTSGGGVNIFSDVNEDDWFYSAVVDSTQYGWINGYPDGTFRPEATISRAEVTVIVNHMLGRAADRPYVIAHEEELNTFGDVNRGHWGYFHVAEATNAHEYHTEDGTESWTGLS